MSTLAEQIVICGNQGLPVEQRIVDKVPVGVRNEEGFEAACYLCDGRQPMCLGYVKPK